MKKGQFGRGAALWGLFVLLGGGLAQAAADGRAPALKIAVSPSVALYGTPFSLKVTGLRPGEQAAIKAVSTDARKIYGNRRPSSKQTGPEPSMRPVKLPSPGAMGRPIFSGSYGP